jgi:hypothetical protein
MENGSMMCVLIRLRTKPYIHTSNTKKITHELLQIDNYEEFIT